MLESQVAELKAQLQAKQAEQTDATNRWMARVSDLESAAPRNPSHAPPKGKCAVELGRLSAL